METGKNTEKEKVSKVNEAPMFICNKHSMYVQGEPDSETIHLK